MKRTVLATILLALVFVVGLGSSQAQAATQTGCIVTKQQYDNSPRLVVWCSGVGSLFYSFGPGWSASCSPVTVDTLKLWSSMVQTALLSAKKIEMDYTTDPGCSNVPIIQYLRLTNQ